MQRDAESKRLRFATPLVLIVGALLTVWMTGEALGLRNRLPAAQYRRVPAQHWQSAQAIVNAYRTTSYAWACRGLSRIITETHLGRRTPEDARALASNVVRNVPRPLARLQLASIRLLAAPPEASPDQRWARVSDLLVGLEEADFSHNLDPMLRAIGGSFQNLGLDPATAIELAFESFGYDHGPFLQVFVMQLQALIADRAAEGDIDGADACRRILARLLMQWTDEPGPPGLRLLAADKLSRAVESGILTDDVVAAAAQRAATLRAEYRKRARGLPGSLLALTGLPQPNAETQARLVARVLLASGLAASAITAGLISVLAAGLTWRRPAFPSLGRWLATAGVVAIASIAVIVWYVVSEDPFDAVRGGFPMDQPVGMHMWIAGGATILIAFFAGAIPGTSSWLSRSVAACQAGWPILAIAAIIALYVSETAVDQHQAAAIASYKDRVAAVLQTPQTPQ